MSLKIRLQRAGAKKKPFYRIVVATSTAPRDGKFIEKIGTYNPNVAKDSKERLVLNQERATFWLKTGAVPTERVAIFIAKLGFANDNSAVTEIMKKRDNSIKISKAKIEAEAAKKAAAEAAEKAKADAAAAKAAAEEAKAAAEKAKADAEAAKAAAATEAPVEAPAA
jgi:small subunit ribosomal protein S16